MIALALLFVLAVVPAARAQQPGGLLVTFAARTCPTYTDISANRARNDIQESLRDLGADTTYAPGQMIDPAAEQAAQPNCHPLPNWTFSLGTGYSTRAVTGPWGALSIVTGAFSTPITTQDSTALLDDQGQPTGQTIAGASTIELTPEQAAIAARPNSLWAQGGTPSDPILDQPYPGQYGFGALRCAIDDLNGDNVEWIGFPSGVRHVFCFAYYVQPPPTSGTIVIRKQTVAPAGTSESFPFQGNVSFNEHGNFALNVSSGHAAQQSFFRAETQPGDAPWTAREIVPANWKLTGLSCVSDSGQSTTAASLADASVAISLAPADTATCTYTDQFVPPNGGLLIRKSTLGGVGRFSFKVKPASGGSGVSASAETKREGLAVDATPSPLSLAPGDYVLSERPPPSAVGRWELSGVQCGGRELPASAAIPVSVVSGSSTTCTLTNTLVPLGSITISKITRGGLATTGFVISPESGPAIELHQSATTTHEGVPATATGDEADGLELGRYVIQETTPEPAGSGRWELASVQCDGRGVPFADGQAHVTLTAAERSVACTFTNDHVTPPEPPEPKSPEVDPTTGLTVSKRALRAQAVPGEPIAYELSVTNHGPAAAEDVVVDDQPSGPATLVSVDPSQGSCNRSVPTTCLLGALAAGQSATVAITLIPHDLGPFTNSAVLGTSSLDPSYAANAAAARVAVRHSLAAKRPARSRGPAFTG